jgi:hypothetical protein
MKLALIMYFAFIAAMSFKARAMTHLSLIPYKSAITQCFQRVQYDTKFEAMLEREYKEMHTFFNQVFNCPDNMHCTATLHKNMVPFKQSELSDLEIRVDHPDDDFFFEGEDRQKTDDDGNYVFNIVSEFVLYKNLADYKVKVYEELVNPAFITLKIKKEALINLRAEDSEGETYGGVFMDRDFVCKNMDFHFAPQIWQPKSY